MFDIMTCDVINIKARISVFCIFSCIIGIVCIADRNLFE